MKLMSFLFGFSGVFTLAMASGPAPASDRSLRTARNSLSDVAERNLAARDDVCIKLENTWIVCRRGCTIKECHTTCLTDMCYDPATLSGQCKFGVTCEGVPDPDAVCYEKWRVFNTCHKFCQKETDPVKDKECHRHCYQALCSHVPKASTQRCDRIHQFRECSNPTRYLTMRGEGSAASIIARARN